MPRSFKVKSLRDFVGDLPDELLLCPVRALRIYLDRMDPIRPGPRTLFRSPSNPSRSISKNAISFFIRSVIMSSFDSSSGPGPSTRRLSHSVRSMATSLAFKRNFPLSSILEAATWKSANVFISFYLKDLEFSFQDGFGLGPFVAAQST